MKEEEEKMDYKSDDDDHSSSSFIQNGVHISVHPSVLRYQQQQQQQQRQRQRQQDDREYAEYDDHDEQGGQMSALEHEQYLREYYRAYYQQQHHDVNADHWNIDEEIEAPSVQLDEIFGDPSQLQNLLRAWYYAGYYAGFYQAKSGGGKEKS